MERALNEFDASRQAIVEVQDQTVRYKQELLALDEIETKANILYAQYVTCDDPEFLEQTKQLLEERVKSLMLNASIREGISSVAGPGGRSLE